MLNKKYLIILILIFFLSIFGFVFIQKNKPNRTIAPPTDIPNITKNNKKNNLKQNTANNNSTSTKKSVIRTDKYYYDLAKSNLDYNECENITSITSKNICYQQIALSLNKEKICEYINDDKRLKECLELIKMEKIKQDGDISKCNILNDSMLQITCIKNMILNDKQINCLKIENDELREYCRAENYFYIAKKIMTPIIVKK